MIEGHVRSFFVQIGTLNVMYRTPYLSLKYLATSLSKDFNRKLLRLIERNDLAWILSLLPDSCKNTTLTLFPRRCASE